MDMDIGRQWREKVACLDKITLRTKWNFDEEEKDGVGFTRNYISRQV